MQQRQTKRVIILFAIFLAWSLATFVRLVDLQVFEHDSLQKLQQRQSTATRIVLALRGNIYDRNHNLLATSAVLESAFVNPRCVPDIQVASDLLSGLLDSNRKQLVKRFEASRDRSFMWIHRRMSPDQALRLRSLGLSWIQFRSEEARLFPHDWLGRDVIGSVTYGVNGVKGHSGIERAQDLILRGSNGTIAVLLDAKRNAYSHVVKMATIAGRDVNLTIDLTSQFELESAMHKVMKSTCACPLA